ADQPPRDHQCLTGRNKVAPGPFGSAVLEVTGNETHRLGMIAVGQWNAGVSGTTGSGGDAAHNLEGNALGRQLLDLLATATENEGVTAFQTQDTLALFGQIDQPLVDCLLW